MKYGRYSQETKDLLNSIGEIGLERTINMLTTVAYDIETSNTTAVFFEGGLRLLIYTEAEIFGACVETETNFSFYNEKNEVLVSGITLENQKSIKYDEQKFKDEDERKVKYEKEEENRKTQRECIENMQRESFLKNFHK